MTALNIQILIFGWHSCGIKTNKAVLTVDILFLNLKPLYFGLGTKISFKIKVIHKTMVITFYFYNFFASYVNIFKAVFTSSNF